MSPGETARAASFSFLIFVTNLIEHCETFPASGKSGIWREVEQRFGDLFLTRAVAQRHAYIEFQPLRLAECRERRNGAKAFGLAIKAGPAPDVTRQKLDNVAFEVRRKRKPSLADLLRAFFA